MVWHLRTRFGDDLIISRRREGVAQARSSPPPAAAVRSLLNDGLLGSDRSARDILLQIYRDVSGMDLPSGHAGQELEIRRQVMPALERAFRGGQLVVVRRRA